VSKLVSILIPARNEEWLARTVEDVVTKMKGDSEVIVVLDGAWAEPPLDKNDRVTVIKLPHSIGQRAATNMAARVAQGKYVMKLDAHCQVGEGFDKILAEHGDALGPNVCQIPAQYNLHAFNWVCTGGHKVYQGPTPVNGCTWKPKNAKVEDPICGLPATREIVWKRRTSRLTTSWRFDKSLHFQYWGQHQEIHKKEQIHDVMSCLGACWFVNRGHFLLLGGLDEAHGSWGQMGTELACKFWLSGGRMVVNKHTWFAHLFRTQGGDFSFPYPLSGTQQAQARERSAWLWKQGNWPMAIRTLKSLIQQFDPPDWKEKTNGLSGRTTHPTVVEREAGSSISISVSHAFDDSGQALSDVRSDAPTKGCIWYTDHRASEAILFSSLDHIQRAAPHFPLVRVGIEHVPYIDVLVPNSQRGYLTMFKQIVAGLRALKTDIVFFCEHDVLYHPSHFEFDPPKRDVYYYNMNVWKVDVSSGRAVTYRTKQTSGLVGYRELLLEHYTKRVELVKRNGFSRKMGFEPGSHGRSERVDDIKSEEFRSEFPNIDLRHSKNLTPTRWMQAQFRDQRNCRDWKLSNAENIPGWPGLASFLESIK